MRLHTEGTTSIDVAIHIETAGGLIRVHDLVAALVVPDLVHVAAPVADFAVTFLISSRSVFYFIF